MSRFNRDTLLKGLTVVAGACVLATSAYAQEVIYVRTAPPPPRVETIPVLPPERVEVERWQPGYWQWNGGEYAWVEGHYVGMPHPRADWIPGRWESRPEGWLYIQGHWS